MNYYAVTALLARVYNYAGEHEKAACCAREVIDARIEEYLADCFPLTDAGKVKGPKTVWRGDFCFVEHAECGQLSAVLYDGE